MHPLIAIMGATLTLKLFQEVGRENFNFLHRIKLSATYSPQHPININSIPTHTLTHCRGTNSRRQSCSTSRTDRRGTFRRTPLQASYCSSPPTRCADNTWWRTDTSPVWSSTRRGSVVSLSESRRHNPWWDSRPASRSSRSAIDELVGRQSHNYCPQWSAPAPFPPSRDATSFVGRPRASASSHSRYLSPPLGTWRPYRMDRRFRHCGTASDQVESFACPRQTRQRSSYRHRSVASVVCNGCGNPNCPAPSLPVDCRSGSRACSIWANSCLQWALPRVRVGIDLPKWRRRVYNKIGVHTIDPNGV